MNEQQSNPLQPSVAFWLMLNRSFNLMSHKYLIASLICWASAGVGMAIGLAFTLSVGWGIGWIFGSTTPGAIFGLAWYLFGFMVPSYGQ